MYHFRVKSFSIPFYKADWTKKIRRLVKWEKMDLNSKKAHLLYKVHPRYPSADEFEIELKRGYTTRFVYDLACIQKFEPELTLLVNDLLDLVSKKKIPPQKENEEGKSKGYNPSANWKELGTYSRKLKHLLNARKFHFNVAKVFSIALRPESLTNPSDIKGKGVRRIIYEYVDGRLCFCNIDQHVYRDSLYSLGVDLGLNDSAS